MPKLTDESLMPFGKHKGVKLANVPAQYLYWLYTKGDIQADLKQYIKENLDTIKPDAQKEQLKYLKERDRGLNDYSRQEKEMRDDHYYKD